VQLCITTLIDSDGHNDYLQYRNESNVNEEFNFIIRNAPRGMSYLPTIPDGDRDDITAPLMEAHTVQATILQVMHRLHIRRPRHNIVRNGIGQSQNVPGIEDTYYAPA
jgi:hypothetical protein